MFMPARMHALLGGSSAGGAPASVSYGATTNSSIGGTVGTFNSFSIGAAAADRYVVVALGIDFEGQDADTATVALTLNGVAATLLASRFETDLDRACVYLFGLAIPTGTTANIGFTANFTMAHAVLSAFALYGLQSTVPVDTGTAVAVGTAAANLNPTAQPSGVVIAASVKYDATTGTPACTWTGVTEAYDAAQSAQYAFSSASALTTATSHSISCTWSGGNDSAVICASFR